MAPKATSFAAIAIVGANGQVGTELVLRMAGIPELELVPIVRNRSGSAFLRSYGVDCRHGVITDHAQARELLSGCDTVLNLAHANSYIAKRRAVNTSVQVAINIAAPAQSKIVFASTQMVYAPELPVRIPGTYGAEKLLLEKKAARHARRLEKDFFVLRFGHVLGELQAISRKIVEEIESGPVPMVNGGVRASNTTFVASLADALVRITDHRVEGRTYDLITSPQWSWEQVYAFHADQIDRPLTIVSTPGPTSIGSRVIADLVGFATETALKQRVRERLAFAMRWLPADANEQLYAMSQTRRAGVEIAALNPMAVGSVVDAWRAIDRNPIRVASPTESLAKYPLPAMERKQLVGAENGGPS